MLRGGLGLLALSDRGIVQDDIHQCDFSSWFCFMRKLRLFGHKIGQILHKHVHIDADSEEPYFEYEAYHSSMFCALCLPNASLISFWI